MANKRIRMITLRQIIRLKTEGVSNRQVAKDLSLGRRTVNKYTKRIDALGITYQDLSSLSDEDLQELFEPPAKVSPDPEKHKKLVELFPHFEKELKRVGVTKWNLWAEYKIQNPDGYSYSRFCNSYLEWVKQKEVTMHFEHKAGDKMMVDYAGKKLEIVDKETGEVKKLEVFVAILGASQITYVEATATQKKEDFIGACENALIYFGGVPKGIVCDNLKSAVKKSSKYEPQLNEAFEDFAHHYKTTILPTRSAKPRDKSPVENAVKIAYTRIYAPLRNRTFFSIEELNAAIREQVEKHNNQCFQGKDYSRQELFNEIEKTELSQLPNERYELKKYVWLTVHKNSHILLTEDKHYYSVPYKYTGLKVKVVYSRSLVEVYRNYTRIASHQRNRSNYKYSTTKEHMPSSHNFVADWNPEKFLEWSKSIGEATEILIGKILESKAHPEQAYKACIGIIAYAKKIGNERLNNACRRALYYETYDYQTVKNIINKRLDEIMPEEQVVQGNLPFHDNIRGKNYYQ